MTSGEKMIWAAAFVASLAEGGHGSYGCEGCYAGG